MLIPITRVKNWMKVLYELLEERTPEQSISHKKLPTFEDHEAFVNSNPYLVWYFIEHDKVIMGSIYLTNQREIGIFIFKRHQAKGFGKVAVEALMEKHPGKFLANISPNNKESLQFFEDLGFELIQKTYGIDNGK